MSNMSLISDSHRAYGPGDYQQVAFRHPNTRVLRVEKAFGKSQERSRMELANQLVSMDHYYMRSPTRASLSDSSCASFPDNMVFQLNDSLDSSSDYSYQGLILSAPFNNEEDQDFCLNKCDSFEDSLRQIEVIDERAVARENEELKPIRTTQARSGLKKIPRTSRITRNVAEKQRRDKLNSCISKLATLVPLVSLSNKRINKSGILRLAASYLRLHSGGLNGFMKEYAANCFPFLDKELSQLLLEMTEGFAVITNESLKIIFASDLIDSLLKHSVVDVLGQSFYTLIHPDDQSLLEEKILRAEIDNEQGNFSLFCSMLEGNSEGRSRSNCKLMRIVGHRKMYHLGVDSKSDKSGKIYVFIVKLCLVQPQNTIAWTTNPNEITFRSAFTGRCLFVDHKLTILLGIMPLEIEGNSGYDWICKEDHPLAAVAHTQMLTDGYYRGIPIRLLTRNKQALYFMTAGKLVCSVEGGPVDLMYMVCTMIGTEEGERIQALVRHRYANQLGLSAPRDFDEELAAEEAASVVEETEQVSVVQPVKRPRGRPRKYPLSAASTAKPRRTNTNEKDKILTNME